MSIDCRSVAVLINLTPTVTSVAAVRRDEVTARSTAESPIRATSGMATTTRPLPRSDRSLHLRRTEGKALTRRHHSSSPQRLTHVRLSITVRDYLSTMSAAGGCRRRRRYWLARGSGGAAGDGLARPDCGQIAWPGTRLGQPP